MRGALVLIPGKELEKMPKTKTNAAQSGEIDGDPRITPQIETALALLVGEYNPNLLATAGDLRRGKFTVEEAFRLLRRAGNEHAVATTRGVPNSEIQKVLKKVYRAAAGGAMPDVRNASRSLPEPNASAMNAAAAAGAAAGWNLAAFESESDDIPPIDEQTATILPLMFLPDELVLIARKVTDTPGAKKLTDYPRPINRKSFFIPTPAATAFGVTLDGRRSGRCKSMYAPGRRFVGVEWDNMPADKACKVPLDEQAALIAYFACGLSPNPLHRMPLALVVHSGGKSLHAFFATAGRSEEEIYTFYTEVRRCGADRSAFSVSQQVRLPGGTRYNRKTGAEEGRQRVLFLSRSVIARAVADSIKKGGA